jgi:phenylacetate-CoA ligase
MRQLTARERATNYAEIARLYAGFATRPYLSRARLRAYQLERLQALVRFAFDRVPLYHEKYRAHGIGPSDVRTLDDLRHLPTVTKEEILAAYPDGALARGLDEARCLASKSSGSTGRVMTVVHRADRLAIQGLAMHRLLAMMGPYRPWHRFAYIYTSEYPSRGVLGAYPMRWIHTLSPTREIARELEAFRPHYLASYPSHLRALVAELGPERARGLGLSGVSVSSEPSSPAERAELGRALGCRVHDEYSTEELTRVAAECRHGTSHLFEDVVIPEILDEASDRALSPGTLGELAGTYLHNFAMPFIRYRQGDLATLETAHCACGSRFHRLGRLEGRKLDSFVLPSGRELTSGFLLDATYAFLLEVGADLAAFRLVQEAPDRVRIDVEPGPRFAPWMRDAIRRRFLELAGEPLAVEIALLDRLPRSAAGKHRPIVSLAGARPG